jgi:hypothetical protein
VTGWPPLPFDLAVPCGRCGRRIIWADTEAGKAIPLVAQPTWRGACEVFETDPPTVRHVGADGKLLMRWERPNENPRLYRNHLIDCHAPSSESADASLFRGVR